ncbi:palmitoyltransferase ZDHHC23 isoform X2 [Alligator mississippiensis]|uniref:palmitoyltransferase ZDHHC23 isoform X2 n=1 Tax=Alligator mississippiensis TaxID=8496 RepID=UPI00287808F6|nr:palmitoyltransferase ZDHHC23 isoform X2 [Alligator mississippiensis]
MAGGAGRPGPGPGEPLCCCEYVARGGERAHLVAVLCDCQDLDEGCDRLLTCRSLPPGMLERIADTVSDRFRIPWFTGAVKVNVSLIPPLVLLPVFLHVAALHFLLAFVILTSLPIVVLWYYYLTHRRKEQTLFFLSLGLFSLGYMYYVFLREVVPQGHVHHAQVALLTCGLVLMLVALSRAKRDPGYLPSCTSNDKSPCQGSTKLLSRKVLGIANGLQGAAGPGVPSSRVVNGDTKGYSRTPAEGSAEAKEDWCPKCQVVQPARAGHCRLCGRINSCVGEQNHQAFILVLSFFLLTAVYGIMLTLNTICRGQATFLALFYCPGVYSDYSSALSFTCVWYCTIVTSGMGYILLIQLLNISYNVTEREARMALRDNSGRRLLGGLVIDTGQISQISSKTYQLSRTWEFKSTWCHHQQVSSLSGSSTWGFR